MKQSIKPSSIQIVAGILFVVVQCFQFAGSLIDKIIVNNGISWELAHFFTNTTGTLFLLIGLSLLLFSAKEKPVRFALIVGIIVDFLGIAVGYYLCTRITEAGQITLEIYNLDMLQILISCFVWVWLFSIILRDKSLSRMGWIQMIPVILIINIGLYVFGLVVSNFDYPGKDFMTENIFFENFAYRFWTSYIMPFFRMIGFYFLATSELFNKQYSTESTTVGWKAYSPFNKWMAATLIAPIVIIPLTILVYNL